MNVERVSRFSNLLKIFTHLDDALTDWLLLTGATGGKKPSGDICFRDHIGLDDLDIRSRLKRGNRPLPSTSASVISFASDVIKTTGLLVGTELSLTPLL